MIIIILAGHLDDVLRVGNMEGENEDYEELSEI